MLNPARALDRNADRFPDLPAVYWRGAWITHCEFQTRVNALAKGLSELGVGRGDIVALLMQNRREFVETVMAANKLGAIFLPLNFRLARDEWRYILGHAGACALVVETSYLVHARSLVEELGLPLLVVADSRPGAEPSIESLINTHLGQGIESADCRENDVQRLMYTSGTTSRPKGVPLTYGNVLHKIFAHVIEFGLTSSDRTLMAGPMYHVGALDLPGLGTWYVGGSLVILPRFDPQGVLAAIETQRPTNVWLAPAMVNAILQFPDLGRYDASSIRLIINGGEKMPVALIERLVRAFPNAWLADAYGLTETVAGDTFLDRASTVTKIGSVGKPVIHLDVRIARDDGSPARPGESGEILLRGPKVFHGYWKDPEATAAAFIEDWFRTGDVGHLDGEGYLFIDDRKKDMIVSGGENIATPEIERVLYEHPAVLEAAVVGMPDPRWGEVPRAFVTLRPGAVVTPVQLVEYCAERLAKFKVPRVIELIDELPRNPSGKVLKRLLRERLQQK